MKIILTESQKSLILEQEGFDEFLSKLSEKKPDSVYVMEFLSDFIKKSGCQRIEFKLFNNQYHGVSLHDRVLINEIVLKNNLTYILYVIFHEIAHQYQYKKYGIDKMYGMYSGDISISEGAKWLKNVVEIADDCAFRKIRELMKKTDKIKFNYESLRKNYDNINLSIYEQIINHVISIIKKGDYKNKIDISEIIYNNVLNRV